MTDLRIVDLRMSYGAVRIFDGVNLVVPDGALLALLGPSGCGKSTMLQLLAGFQRPSGGEIWAGNQCLSSRSIMVPTEQRGISMVFQNYAVWPHMTVAENVAFGLKIQRLTPSERSRKLTGALKMVRLETLRDRYPAELSGGQQQRVALARALAVEPKILALDEPLSNLDAHLREEMRFEIRRVHDLLGITTVYVTHDQSEALVTADRIAVMHAGSVVQVGAPEDLFERPANSFVAGFIGSNNVLSRPVGRTRPSADRAPFGSWYRQQQRWTGRRRRVLHQAVSGVGRPGAHGRIQRTAGHDCPLVIFGREPRPAYQRRRFCSAPRFGGSFATVFRRPAGHGVPAGRELLDREFFGYMMREP